VSKFKKSCFYSFVFFGIVILIYTVSVAIYLSASDSTSAKLPWESFKPFFKAVMVAAGYSAVFGVSFLLFDIPAPQAVKRFLHVLVLYIFAVGAVLILLYAGTEKQTRDAILMVLFTSLLFAVVYAASTVISAIVRRAIKKR